MRIGCPGATSNLLHGCQSGFCQSMDAPEFEHLLDIVLQASQKVNLYMYMSWVFRFQLKAFGVKKNLREKRLLWRY